MIRISSEAVVVENEKLRAEIIKEINGDENQQRKQEAWRRHLVLKDKVKNYVLDELLKQFDPDTVREMSYSIANISVGRKIIEKLARVYSAGVKREGKSEKETKQIEALAKRLRLNQNMKRANKYMKAHRNCLVGVLPCEYEKNGSKQYGLKVHVLEPYLYDAIEHEYDRERAVFYIISDFKAKNPTLYTTGDAAKGDRGVTMPQVKPPSDGKDQMIADPDDGLKDERYIWWSDSFHFTTNGKGEILPNAEGKMDVTNPILENPYENFAIDQDGKFWAEGGDDIFDGSVRVNSMITNMDHIGVMQGYGQFYMKGKGLPSIVKTGPNKIIKMEVENSDDPDPSIGFASSDPKLTELKDQIIMYVALLLSTNNLSTRAVAAELDGSTDVASGVAIMLDKAESVEDVEDQRQIFLDSEPNILRKAAKWLGIYKLRGLLQEAWGDALMDPNTEFTMQFQDPGTIMSEKEKLENLKLRKDLGINLLVELIMKDDPSLTQEQAEKKLMDLLAEKQKMAALLKPEPEEADNDPADPANPEEEETDEGDGDDGERQQDDEQD